MTDDHGRLSQRAVFVRARMMVVYGNVIRVIRVVRGGEHGIQLEVVKLPEAKRGFVLLPRRWVVERSFAWTTRFRRLVDCQTAALIISHDATVSAKMDDDWRAGTVRRAAMKQIVKKFAEGIGSKCLLNLRWFAREKATQEQTA